MSEPSSPQLPQSLPVTSGVDYPAGSTICDLKLIGAAKINDFVFAFILLKTQDASGAQSTQLLAATSNNGAWQQTTVSGQATYWGPLGAPSVGISFEGTCAPTVLVSGQIISVFVCGAGGHQAWCIVWNQGWTAWTACAPAADVPAADAPVVNIVDHAAGEFVYVRDADDQAWAISNADGQWVATKQDNSVITNIRWLVELVLMNDGFYYAMSAAHDGLDLKLYNATTVTTNRCVMVNIASATGQDEQWVGPRGPEPLENVPCVSVMGFNPLEPGVLVQTPWVSAASGVVIIDLTTAKDFQEGACCWVRVQGGRAHLDGVGLENAYDEDSINLKTTYPVRAAASQANFTYSPSMPTGPQGGNVSYVMSVKGAAHSAYWSFSSCSNHV